MFPAMNRKYKALRLAEKVDLYYSVFDRRGSVTYLYNGKSYLFWFSDRDFLEDRNFRDLFKDESFRKKNENGRKLPNASGLTGR